VNVLCSLSFYGITASKLLCTDTLLSNKTIRNILTVYNRGSKQEVGIPLKGNFRISGELEPQIGTQIVVIDLYAD